MRVRLVWEFDANANGMEDEYKDIYAEVITRAEMQVLIDKNLISSNDFGFEVIDREDNPDYDENGILKGDIRYEMDS